MRTLGNLFLATLLVVIVSGCFTSHRFRDSKIRKLPDKSFQVDSLIAVKPIIRGFYSPSFDRNFYAPTELFSRPDSISNHLSRRLINELNISLNEVEHQKFGNDTLYGLVLRFLWDQDYSIQKRRFLIDSVFVGSYFKPDETKARLIFIFRLEIGESGNSSLEKFDELFGSIIIVDKGKMIYYRQFRSNIRFGRRFFPKDSEDHKNFPHFPQWQIERVVDALVDDLKKRVQ